MYKSRQAESYRKVKKIPLSVFINGVDAALLRGGEDDIQSPSIQFSSTQEHSLILSGIISISCSSQSGEYVKLTITSSGKGLRVTGI